MKKIHIDNDNNWATPPYFYRKLDERFDFDFDPCPYNDGELEFDGLEIEWGNNLFVNFFNGNFVEWKNYNAQSAKSINIHQILHQEPIDQEGIYHNVKNVSLIEIANEIGIKEKKKENLLKDTNWKSLGCNDALSAKLLNHLKKIILILTKDAKLDIHQTVKCVQERHQEKQWLKEERIQIQQALLRVIKLSIENQKEGDINITKEIESEIINVDQKFFNGQNLTGKSASYIFQTNVSIVDQKNFLLKTILFLYQMIIAQEQYQQTSFPPALDATVLKITKTLMNGHLMNHLKELGSISIRLNHKASIFVNPPYSRKLKELFVKKGIEEANKGKLCVFLLPVSTSTALFHDYIVPNASEIMLVRGRLKFGKIDKDGNFYLPLNKHGKVSGGTKDSMVIVFDGRNS